MGKNSTGVLSGGCLDVLYYFQIEGSVRYNWLGVALCHLILSPMTVILNGMVLLSVYKKRDLWTNTYFFLCGLALTDLLNGLLSLPIMGSLYISVYTGWMSCYLYVTGFALGYIFVGTSFVSIGLLSTDRYLAVFHPFLYERKTHDQFLPWKITFLSWIITILLVFCSFFTPRFIMYFVLVVLIMPVSITWLFYVQTRIVNVVKRVSSDIEQRNQPTSRATRRERRQYKRDRKVTYLATVMVVTMVLCYTPAVVVLFAAYSGLASKSLYDRRFVAYGWALTIANTNSVLNPLIFGVRMTEIRRGMKEIIYKLFKMEIKDSSSIHSTSGFHGRFSLGQSNMGTTQVDLEPSRVNGL